MMEKDQTSDGDRYIVPALRRGLAVLRLFTRERSLLTVPEIVRELKVSRASAFRLVYTLEADGYLQKVPLSNGFRLGINVLSLGFEYLSSLDLLEVARPIVNDLRDRIDASAHLGVRDGRDVVYVLTAPSQHRLRSNVIVGSRMPVHATSIGRVLLFDSSLEELRALYKGVKLERFSPHTPATVHELYEQLQEERARGYVSYRSAYAPGIASVAAPVRDGSGCIVGGVNVSDYESLPAMREQDTLIKDAVLRAAAEISRGMGYRIVEAGSERRAAK